MPLDSKPWADPEAKPLDADGEILERAAQIIEEYGWCQGDWGDTAGHSCFNYACIRALKMATPNDLAAAHAMLDRFAVRAGFTGYGHATKWNDAPSRTAAEVVARLRSAARREL